MNRAKAIKGENINFVKSMRMENMTGTKMIKGENTNFARTMKEENMTDAKLNKGENMNISANFSRFISSFDLSESHCREKFRKYRQRL